MIPKTKVVAFTVTLLHTSKYVCKRSSPGSFWNQVHITRFQWRTWIFLHPAQLVTIAAPNKNYEFYVILTLHPCIISQINPTRCTILFNIFIYYSSLHVSGIHVPINRRKVLYLCDIGICHSVCVACGRLVGVKLVGNQFQTRNK